MSGEPLVNDALDWFVQVSLAQVPWLTSAEIDLRTKVATPSQNVFTGDPGVVYPGPKPYLVWTCPQHSVGRRESGSIGNIKGRPNVYVGSYRATPYASPTADMNEQRLAYNAYGLIAKYLMPMVTDVSAPCPPQGIQILTVAEEHHTDAMYIDTPAGPMVGILIIVSVDERY